MPSDWTESRLPRIGVDMNVEYHRLRPQELVQRRTECPVAYLGLGILEWHGQHNPLGLDGLKAHGVGCHLAESIGGVAMPPLYWGDNRAEICEVVFDPAVSPWLPEGTTDHTKSIAREMDIPLSRFKANAKRSTEAGGWKLWEDLLKHMLHQIDSLGFALIVIIPGHYPLFGPVERAVKAYSTETESSEVFVLTDRMIDPDGDSGDHAAAFETSALMAIEPELVDLKALDSDPNTAPIGVLGNDPRTEASVEYGERILDRFVEIANRRISEFFR